jgi:DNA-binding transcriptional LysR family regulator
MDQLETRELAYFVAVAEELHFGRAAERLGIAQPPLSRAVSRLERRMGVRLLERAADPLRLVLAVRPGTGSGLLAQALRSHDGAVPELAFTQDQAGALRDATADFALLCTDSSDLTGLKITEVAEESPVALLARDHRLARRAMVTTAELRSEPGYQEQCPPMGLDEILDRVALGRLIAVVGSTAADRLTREVTAVPVADLPPTTVALGWLPQAARPEILSFARSLQRVAAGSGAPRLRQVAP